MKAQSFDVIVIGGGIGGYVCAIRASQLGFKVACIEKHPSLGGTCLNVGCIPSKALLTSSYKFYEAQQKLKAHGIHAEAVKLDLEAMLARKTHIVEDLVKGVDFLFRKNKITLFQGQASFVSQNSVNVRLREEGQQQLTAKHIVIATGSAATSLPGFEIDEKRIVTSTGALSLEKAPEHLAVIGGGYIGLELGSVWRHLGAKVTIIEFSDKIVPLLDQETGQTLYKQLQIQGIDFKFEAKATGFQENPRGIELVLESTTGKKMNSLPCDVVLVAVGRKPYSEGLGLEKIKVKHDEQGYIITDDRYETNIPGIYAIGDVTKGPMLAHKAEEEGIVLAELLAGQKGSQVNYNLIPSVIYTHPEVASVGKTEEQLKAKGIHYKKGSFPLRANSRAKTNDETEGFVKILADAETDRVLGVHIIASNAGTLIAEAVTAMEFSASAEDIARICHAHPTFNEALKEAALAVAGQAIHV